MKKYKVIIDSNATELPHDHEMRAAMILAKNLKCDIRFIRASMYRTPDFEIKGELWELKSPTGNSKKTIENNLRSAKGQSKNIVLDLTRTRMTLQRAKSRINYYLSNASGSGIKHLIVIDSADKSKLTP